MIWFLRLFRQYRALERAVREGGDLSTRLQDQNFTLSEQNVRLVEEAQESRRAEIDALKAMANIKIQLEFGGLPPYREAYSLPKQVEHELGPVPTNREQGRDAVRASTEQFRQQMRSRQ